MGNNPAGVVISNIVSQGEELWATAVEGGVPDDSHGHAGAGPKGKAIIKKTFSAAGKAFGMDTADSRRNTLALLEEQQEEKE